MSTRYHPVADGAHSGMRWFVARHDGKDEPIVTVIGFVGDLYVFEQQDMLGATKGKVCAWVDQVVEAAQVKVNKARAKIDAKISAQGQA